MGGGFGGLDAARTLGGSAAVRVTLVDRHNYHLFQPPLYQVATAALSPGDVALPIRWILRRHRNVRVLLAEARGIDTAARTVTLDPGPAVAGHHDEDAGCRTTTWSYLTFQRRIRLITGGKLWPDDPPA